MILKGARGAGPCIVTISISASFLGWFFLLFLERLRGVAHYLNLGGISRYSLLAHALAVLRRCFLEVVVGAPLSLEVALALSRQLLVHREAKIAHTRPGIVILDGKKRLFGSSGSR